MFKFEIGKKNLREKNRQLSMTKAACQKCFMLARD
jgi:hypothetical protein